MALVLIGLAALVGLFSAGAIQLAYRRSRPGDANRTVVTRLPMRIVFVEASTTDARVDCLLPIRSDGPTDHPLSLRLRCPDEAGVWDAAVTVLEHWADEQRLITIDLDEEPTHGRTHLRAGDATVQVVLEEAV